MTTNLHAEGPTWAAFAICYGAWFALTANADAGWWVYGLLAFVIAFHSSLQHEAIHDHPTRWPFLNEAIAAWPLGLSFPYRCYKAMHLAHHRDARLTDPYDDPESWYLDPVAWETAPRWRRALLTVNNCLLGRLLFGPALSVYGYLRVAISSLMSGKREMILSWTLHIAAAAIVISWLMFAGVSAFGYAVTCYFGLSLINLRSFLEHKAEDRVRGRSAIVEDGGLFGLLFLHNNLHAVHHAHPNVSWSLLPALYRRHKDRFLAMNGGYFYPSYLSVFRAHALKPKEPPAHPKMQSLGR